LPRLTQLIAGSPFGVRVTSQKRLTDSTVSSAVNATNESGGEAEIAGGVGVRCGPRREVYGALVGAAHSGAPRGLCRYRAAISMMDRCARKDDAGEQVGVEMEMKNLARI
jgi:hypothetical protein